MVATLTPRVYTGSSAGTESAAVTGIDWVSIDNAVNSGTNRTDYPVQGGTASFEKHVRLKLDVAPATAVTNFKFWMSSSAVSNILLRAKLAVGTGGASPGTGDSTPTATAMTGDADAYSYTTGARGAWDVASYSTINYVTKAILLQLQPNTSATPGAMAQQTMNYAYDET